MGGVKTPGEGIMRIVIRIAVESDDGRAVKEKEILRIGRNMESTLADSGLGLTMPEAKATLRRVRVRLNKRHESPTGFPANP
jgi:hypothetical protein